MIALDNLLHWYASLTPQSIRDVAKFYQADAHFKDPFNDVRGVAGIEAIFVHMFETTEFPRFIIGERIEQAHQAFVTWTFEFSLKGKAYCVVGGSHFVFDDHGLVIEHRDYWDAAEELFQKLPIVGAPIRWLRRRFAV
jgi:hypothetical protein